MVPGEWWPLAELPWRPVCSAHDLWLKACCSPRNRRPLWQAPSPSSSIGDEFKEDKITPHDKRTLNFISHIFMETHFSR